MCRSHDTGREGEELRRVVSGTHNSFPVFDGGDKVVIGKQIGTISSVGNNNSNIIPSSDIYVQNNAEVYRVGYEVQVIASNKVLEPTMYGAMERYEDAKKLLEDNRKKLDSIAEFLYKKETITGKEFMEIFHKVKNDNQVEKDELEKLPEIDFEEE